MNGYTNIFGKGLKQIIESLTERKFSLALCRKVVRKTKESVEEAFKNLLYPVKDKVHTITSNNSREFVNHKFVSRVFECGFYYTYIYIFWERESNKNTNVFIHSIFLNTGTLKL